MIEQKIKMLRKGAIKALASALALAAADPAHAQTYAIMDGTVYTVAGGVIEDGDVIIRDGRIVQVGQDLTAPSGADVIDASGKIVTPGIFSPLSDIGLYQIGAVEQGNDASPSEKVDFNASLVAAEGYYPYSVAIPVERAGGVTRTVISLTNYSSFFSGQASLIDLSGRSDAVMLPSVAQISSMGESAVSDFGARSAFWAVIRASLEEVSAYRRDPAAFRNRPQKGRLTAEDAAALVPVIQGEQLLIIKVDGEVDIRKVLELKKTYGLKIALHGAAEGWKVAAELADANVPVIIDALGNLPYEFASIDSTLNNAARLQAAGVRVSFTEGSHKIRQHAGNAVAHGLAYEDALAAITLNPATIYGVDGELGSIEVGKIADVVVWDSDPLDAGGKPTDVFINGEAQPLKTRQDMLFERYRDLSRKELPFPYRGR